MRTIKAQQESTVRQWKDSPKLWQLRAAWIRNSLDLLKEARLLYRHRRYSRAFSLTFTAYEEFGKCQIVSDFITGSASEKEFWAAFRSLNLKSSYNLRHISIRLDRSQPDTVEYNERRTRSLFKMRTDSLYVDCAQDYSPSTPKTTITSEVAKRAIRDIEKYILSILHLEQFTERIGTHALAK